MSIKRLARRVSTLSREATCRESHVAKRCHLQIIVIDAVIFGSLFEQQAIAAAFQAHPHRARQFPAKLPHLVAGVAETTFPATTGFCVQNCQLLYSGMNL